MEQEQIEREKIRLRDRIADLLWKFEDRTELEVTEIEVFDTDEGIPQVIINTVDKAKI